ncbi:MAG: histone H1 [Bacteroidetes bacterium]|nr:histone H1 [Bacteroidota bacterium]
MAKKKKLPADINKRAKSIVDLATNEDAKTEQDAISEAARALGRKGGLKGGVARAESLSAKRRKEIATKAAQARWGNKED